MFIKSYLGNPILSPDSSHPWESIGSFNGCPIKIGDHYHLLYRALGQTKIENQDVQLSTVGIADSKDKTNFTNRRQLIVPELNWEKFGCEDPRITFIDDEYFVFYTAISNYPITSDGIRIGLALSPDLKSISAKHLVTPFNAKAMTLFPKKINGNYGVIFTYGSEQGNSTVAFASFPQKSDIWSPDFWQNWTNTLDHHRLELGRLNTDRVEVGAPPIEIDQGWLIFFSHIQNYYSESKVFGIEAAILDKNDPTKVLFQTSQPIMVPQEDYELQGVVPNVIFPSGALLSNDLIYLYYGAADTSTAVSVMSLTDLLTVMQSTPKHQVKLDKYQNNPILRPNQYYSWQAKAVLNPTVIYHQGIFHLVYRAMSLDNTSVFGYATSTDGYNIDYFHPEPIYVPRADFEIKKVPHGNSGCEDPRITQIGDTLYLVYTAYNGIDPPGIALSSISLADFLNRDWSKWTLPIFISQPGADDKDGCLFPEKINGQYVFFHRPGSDSMCIDSVDNLNFKDYRLTSDFCLALNFNHWDNLRTGIAGVPIKTTKGWLVLYHAINKVDFNYRVGALLFDLNDVSKVIGKIANPILEPAHHYERQGQVGNVVFPCGQVVVNGRLFVYYGGADSYLCVATAQLDDLLDSISYF